MLTYIQGTLASASPLQAAIAPRSIGSERLVIELKDKVGLPGEPSSSILAGSGGHPGSSGTGVDTRIQDAVLALVTLGYKPADADKAVRKALAAGDPEISSEALIKAALR